MLELFRQPCYRWSADPVPAAELVEAHRASALFDAHQEDPEFCCRLLIDEATGAGKVMCERSAWRIVGYSIDSPMLAGPAVQAVQNAVARRGDVADGIVQSASAGWCWWDCWPSSTSPWCSRSAR